MSGAFGGEGGDYIRDQFPESYDDYLAKKEGREGSVGGKFVTFDNSIGEVTLRIPPEFNEHRQDLLQRLYDEYYGTPAGDPKVLEEMNLFVAEWIKKKALETQ